MFVPAGAGMMRAPGISALVLLAARCACAAVACGEGSGPTNRASVGCGIGSGRHRQDPRSQTRTKRASTVNLRHRRKPREFNDVDDHAASIALQAPKRIANIGNGLAPTIVVEDGQR
jgi:hypothetical protein